jgi:endo-1,4-beta-xylanase
MTKYSGKIKEWVVVNEATQGNAIFWANRLGTSYIEAAFRVARTADPDATLIYNDFGGEYQGAPKADKIFAIVKDLKQKGLVDAVGMQMHIIGEGPNNIDPLHPPTKERIVAEMRRYADIGVKVRITELDIVSSGFSGSIAEQQQKQAELYRLPIESALGSGGACDSIVLWGVNDEFSWKKEGSPLLFSGDQPKPSFYAVRDALSQAS